MDLPLTALKGVGPARVKALNAAGITSVRGLIHHLPKEYRDLSDIRPLATLSSGDEAAVRVRVAGGVQMRPAGKKLLVIKARVQDESESMSVVWYNQPWLKDQMTRGRELMLYGRCEVRSGTIQLSSPSIEQELGIQPD